jgi:tRNA1(Val) A37 N6-methylase TrmN6
LEILLNEDERLDDLQYKGLKLIQHKKSFCFGVDAVLLADFASINKNDMILDIGTGNGIIPILLSARNLESKIYGIEIQSEMAALAKRNVTLNKLDDRLSIIHADIKKASEHFKSESFNVIVTNPPYMSKGAGLINTSSSKAIARHELTCSLDDIILTASNLLAPDGQFVMVHRPHRLVDILCALRKHRLEPKVLRFVHPYSSCKPNLVLIKAYKYGHPDLKIMDPLYIYDDNKNYTKELNNIYHREEVNFEY